MTSPRPSPESCMRSIVSLEPFVLACGHYPDRDFRGMKQIGESFACIGCYRGEPPGNTPLPETEVSSETLRLVEANVPSTERCPGCGGQMLPPEFKKDTCTKPPRCARNCYLGNLHRDARERVFKIMREIGEEALSYENEGREQHDRIEVGGAMFDLRLKGAVRQAFLQELRRGENPNRAVEVAQKEARLWISKWNARREWQVHRADMAGDSDAEFLKQRIAYAVHSDGKPPDALCSVCGEHQYETPGGPTCKNGHGGAASIDSGGAERLTPQGVERGNAPAPRGTDGLDIDVGAPPPRERERQEHEHESESVHVALSNEAANQSGECSPGLQALASTGLADSQREEGSASRRDYVQAVSSDGRSGRCDPHGPGMTSQALATDTLVIPYALEDKRPLLDRATAESAQALAISHEARVASPEALEWATGATKHAKDWIDFLESERTTLTRPLLDEKARVDDVFMPAIKNWRAVEQDLKNKMGSYHMAQRAEQERVMRESALVYQQGGTPIAPVPVVVQGEGVGVREVWTFEITNSILVPRELCSPDPEKIELRRAVEMSNTNEPPNIPGIRFYKTVGSVSVRRR